VAALIFKVDYSSGAAHNVLTTHLYFHRAVHLCGIPGNWGPTKGRRFADALPTADFAKIPHIYL
jgi:hypothetical protein